MKQLIRDKSILVIVGLTVLGIILSITCFPEKVSSETDTYLMGRTRISYTVPITPTPTCTQETTTGRFNLSTIC